jgi:hypothetical protein
MNIKSFFGLLADLMLPFGFFVLVGGAAMGDIPLTHDPV